MKRLLLLLLLPASAFSTVLTVPVQYATIQSAIDASVNGDTIEVSPGTYFENINFRGKNVFVTSLYYQASDTAYISSTVINGSMPLSPDTASCVIFSSGEDSTAVLQGFTLTGGGGTRWADIHGAGTYREGGGILIELSSPTVQHNIIVNNVVSNLTNVVSTGGGGIRIGDGNPVIQNNIIMYNQGRYGPGIVLNYTGAIIRNNIIAFNSGGQQYNGGSGIWILENLGSTPKIIENNTIVNNSSTLAAGTGGILVWNAGFVNIRNNIIRDNLPALQLKTVTATPSVTYNNIEGSFAGNGNTDVDPLFGDCLLLASLSPSVDAGDSTSIYNDLSTAPGIALFPSMGTERNDMGAFGGPHASVLNCISGITSAEERFLNQFAFYPNPVAERIIFEHEFSGRIHIYNASGLLVYAEDVARATSLQLKVAAGAYFIQFIEGKRILTQKLFVQ